MNLKSEKKRQDRIPWSRVKYFSDYNSILACFLAQSVAENAYGKNLLDLACGEGIIAGMLSKKFKRIVGVDASRRQLQAAKRNCPSADLHESLIEDFKTNEKFDVVLLMHVIEHVQNPMAILKKAVGFLKKNGKLFVYVPNAMAVNRKISRLMGTLRSEYELSPFDIKVVGHRRYYDTNLLLRDIHAANLKVKKLGGVFYKMLSSPQIDWLLKRGPWKGFGWGRIGGPRKDWKFEFCRACYEFGKQRPEDCNVIYAICQK